MRARDRREPKKAWQDPSLEPTNRSAGAALVIIPCYNEKESIGATVAAVRAAGDWDYLVVDDGSTDGTTGVLEKQVLNHVRLASNLGIGGAVQTGFRYAQEWGYQAGRTTGRRRPARPP